MAEEWMTMGDLNVGRKTDVHEQLQLPKVQPILSFVLFLVNLSAYGTYNNIHALQGPDVAADFLAGLWLHSDLAASPFTVQLAHLLTSQCLAPGPCELLLALWAFALVAPRAESVMGYWPFLSVLGASGFAGGVVQLLMLEAGSGVAPGMAPGACGAAAGIMGLLGCLAVHYATNREVEWQAASWRGPAVDASSSSSDGEGASSNSRSSGLWQPPRTPPPPQHEGPTRQQRAQGLLLWQSVCVAAVSMGLAGMQHLSGHPSDPGGGAGLWGEVALGIGVVPQLVGFATGAAMTLGMGPRYSLLREVHIPEGSMIIPEDAQEMVVVIDRTTRLQRRLTAAAAAAAMLAALQVLSS